MEPPDGISGAADCARARMGNGMEVFHVRGVRFASAAARVLVRTGSVHEGAMCGCGASHFAEHMAFLGAGARGSESVSADAAAIGAELNAYTSYDRTVYSADCPAANFGKSLRLLSEMLFEPNFSEESFLAEREIILREIDMCADDADEGVYDNLFARMYLSSPLRYPVIGLREKFEGVLPSDLRGYFSGRYCAQNMCLCAASPLGHAEFFALAEAAFGKRGGRLEPVFSEPEPPQIAPRETVEYRGCDISKCLLAFKVRAAGAAARAAWRCAAMALGSGNSSVLPRALKYGKGIANSAGAEFFEAAGEGALILSWECAAKDCSAARDAALEELRRFAGAGFSAAERSRYAKSRRAAVAAAMRGAAHAADELCACAFYGSGFELAESLARSVAESDSESSARILSEGLDFGAYTYSEVSPKSARPRRAKPAGAGGAEFRARAEELPGGLRIALVPRAGFGRVHARLYSFGGLCALSPRERGAYPLAALCALRDTSEKSFREISEFAENNAISFYSEFSESSASVCADALPEDLSKAVGLVAGAALDFKIRPETFEAERRAAISDALDDLDDPLTAASIGLRRAFFGRHPLSSHPDGEAGALEAASLRLVEKILAKTFSAGSCALVIAGDFDPREALACCRGAFSKMRGARGAGRIHAFRAPKGRAKMSFGRGKEQAAAFAAFPDGGVSDCGNDAARAVFAEYLGGENGEIFDAVRQREGLAYAASFDRISGSDVSAALFYALTLPQNANGALKIFSRISERLARGGIDAERFCAARACALARMGERFCDPAEAALFAAASLFSRGRLAEPSQLAEEVGEIEISAARRYAARVFSNPFFFLASR